MGLILRCLKNPFNVGISLGVICLIFIFSYRFIVKELFPKVSPPIVIVKINYTGASVEEVESLIAKKIEHNLLNIGGIEDLELRSYSNVFVAVFTFDSDVDIDEKYKELKDLFDEIKKDLPKDAKAPIFNKIVFTESPFAKITLYSSKYSEENLYGYANELKERLLKTKIFSKVELESAQEPELHIRADQEKLEKYNIHFFELYDFIKSTFFSQWAGKFELETKEYLIKVSGIIENFRDLNDQNKVFFKHNIEGHPIYLNDFVTIEWSHKKKSMYTRYNGYDSVLLTVSKMENDNLLDAYDNLELEIEKIRKSPFFDKDHMKIDVFSFQANQMHLNVIKFQQTGLISLILILMCLSFFVNFRYAFIIALSMPFTLIFAVSVLYIFGRPINFVAQFAFNIVLGIVIDGCIVIFEMVKKEFDEGLDIENSLKLGLKKVGTSVLTSGLTTITSFLPLFFISGTAGQFMRIIPEVVIISIVGAILFDHIFLPYFLRFSLTRKRVNLLRSTKLSEISMVTIEYLHNFFAAARAYIFKYPKLSISCFFLSFFFIFIFFISFVKMEFFPNVSDRSEFLLYFKFEKQNLLEEINNKITLIENQIFKDFQNFENPKAAILKYYTYVGHSGFTDFMEALRTPDHPQFALIHFVLDPEILKAEDISVYSFVNQFVKKLNAVNIDTSVLIRDIVSTQGPPRGHDIDIHIQGPQLSTLKKIGREINKILLSTKGLKYVDSSELALSSMEFYLEIDRLKASLYGFNIGQIQNYITSIYNYQIFDAIHYPYKDDIYQVYIRSSKEEIKDINQILELELYSPQLKRSIALKNFIKLKLKEHISNILRKNGERTLNLIANFDFQLVDVYKQIQFIKNKIHKEIKFPEDYKVSFEGEAEKLEKSFQKLIYAFIIALILTNLIVAIQFQSLIQPFIVTLVVVGGFLGVMVSLLLTQIPFSIMSMYAFISLVGISVNDNIVLISYANDLLKSGLSKLEAIEESCILKLRPVILTSVTTMAGVLPYIIIPGNEFWMPFALVIIVGLGFTTLQTLIFTPLWYVLSLRK